MTKHLAFYLHVLEVKSVLHSTGAAGGGTGKHLLSVASVVSFFQTHSFDTAVAVHVALVVNAVQSVTGLSLQNAPSSAVVATYQRHFASLSHAALVPLNPHGITAGALTGLVPQLNLVHVHLLYVSVSPCLIASIGEWQVARCVYT